MMQALHVLAVERRQFDRRGIDILETVHVDGESLLAVWREAARKRADTAGLTEQMMDSLFAELVVGQCIVAMDELELRRLDECPGRAALHADRAVAVDDLRQVAYGLIANAAAVAATLIGLGI